MKKNFKFLAIGILGLTIASCGGADKDTKTTENIDAPVVETVVEEVYEPFDYGSMNGTWTAVDAMGYSKDKIIGQTYTFGDSTASFYASYGDGGMQDAEFSLESGQVILSVSTTDPEMGTSTMTTKYDGGLVGPNKMVLKSQSEQITLERK